MLKYHIAKIWLLTRYRVCEGVYSPLRAVCCAVSGWHDTARLRVRLRVINS